MRIKAAKLYLMPAITREVLVTGLQRPSIEWVILSWKSWKGMLEHWRLGTDLKIKILSHKLSPEIEIKLKENYNIFFTWAWSFAYSPDLGEDKLKTIQCWYEHQDGVEEREILEKVEEEEDVQIWWSNEECRLRETSWTLTRFLKQNVKC